MTAGRYLPRHQRSVEREHGKRLKMIEFGHPKPRAHANLFEDWAQNEVASSSTVYTQIHWDVYGYSHPDIFEPILGDDDLLVAWQFLQPGIYTVQWELDWGVAGGSAWSGTVLSALGDPATGFGIPALRKEHVSTEEYGTDAFLQVVGAFAGLGQPEFWVTQNSGSARQLAGAEGFSGEQGGYCSHDIVYLGPLADLVLLTVVEP